MGDSVEICTRKYIPLYDRYSPPHSPPTVKVICVSFGVQKPPDGQGGAQQRLPQHGFQHPLQARLSLLQHLGVHVLEHFLWGEGQGEAGDRQLLTQSGKITVAMLDLPQRGKRTDFIFCSRYIGTAHCVNTLYYTRVYAMHHRL